MRKGELTRAKLVASTAELMQRQGYHATGLSEIVAHSGAPRGSVYFHFPGGKEELVCESLRESGAEWSQRMEAIVDASPDLGSAVMEVCRELARLLAQSRYELGCPVATVALEASASSKKVRKTCADHYAHWEALIRHRLEKSSVDTDVAARSATFVLSAIEGALLLARVKRDAGPLLATGETLAALFAMFSGVSQS